MARVTTKTLNIIYDELLDVMFDTVLKYKDSQVVASTMISLAFKLYKTILTDNEYKDMIKTVTKNAEKIKAFETRVLH